MDILGHRGRKKLEYAQNANLHIGIRIEMKEKEIENKLIKNLSKIESGLVLVKRQKRVNTGVIDLFCKDRNGKYVILEIKRKPDANVVGQLAKYNMALIKNGINKKNLRTILIAQEISKSVEETCKFFNFEIKRLYKEKNINKEKGILDKINIPSNEELINFIKGNNFVNLSMIARFFNINGTTASDLINDLSKNKLVVIKKFGGNKLVVLKNKRE